MLKNDQNGVREYKSPKHKLLTFFEESRNNWRDKHKATKAKLKGALHAIRTARAARDVWRRRAVAAEAELATGIRIAEASQAAATALEFEVERLTRKHANPQIAVEENSPTLASIKKKSPGTGNNTA